MNDKALIQELIDFLNNKYGCELAIIAFPDKDNRNSRDIDAIAENKNIRVAIEHTSIDPIKNQRRDGFRFDSVIGKIENDLRDTNDYYLRIVIPYNAIQTKQNWKQLNLAMRDWIENEAPCYKEGKSIIKNAKDIPFAFTIIKDLNRNPRVVFYRGSPNDTTLSSRIVQLINDKTSKLSPYAVNGFFTILLLESYDEVHIDPYEIRDIIETNYKNRCPKGLAQIWHCFTSIPHRPDFELLIGEQSNFDV